MSSPHPIFVQTCVGREGYATALRVKLPTATFIKDESRDPLGTWIRMLEAAGSSGAIFLEDDIILSRDFEAKAATIIGRHGASVISFFSQSKVRSAYYPGRTYMGNLAYWVPSILLPPLVSYAKTFTWETGEMDEIMRDFLHEMQHRFYQAIPNLVDHRVGPSMVNHRRSSVRTSATFER